MELADGGRLSQRIYDVVPGCSYEFSFFAKSNGTNTGFYTEVTFVTATGNVIGTEIYLDPGFLVPSDIFSYYRRITTKAPINTGYINVVLNADADTGGVIFDNVSLSIQ
ncbi:MAG: hypothetical protein LKJ17_02580 [Oscillospiraceae bacterium]|nr:hypothetical protein [Oscillospiraceae bacterium]